MFEDLQDSIRELACQSTCVGVRDSKECLIACGSTERFQDYTPANNDPRVQESQRGTEEWERFLPDPIPGDPPLSRSNYTPGPRTPWDEADQPTTIVFLNDLYQTFTYDPCSLPEEYRDVAGVECEVSSNK